MEESLQSLLECLKVLSKKHDTDAFYPTMMYYQAIRWIKLVKRGAIFKLCNEDQIGGPNLCWDLPNNEKE